MCGVRSFVCSLVIVIVNVAYAEMCEPVFCAIGVSNAVEYPCDIGTEVSFDYSGSAGMFVDHRSDIIHHTVENHKVSCGDFFTCPFALWNRWRWGGAGLLQRNVWHHCCCCCI